MWKITVEYQGGSQSQFIDNRKGEISLQLAKEFYSKYKDTAKKCYISRLSSQGT